MQISDVQEKSPATWADWWAAGAQTSCFIYCEGNLKNNDAICSGKEPNEPEPVLVSPRSECVEMSRKDSDEHTSGKAMKSESGYIFYGRCSTLGQCN